MCSSSVPCGGFCAVPLAGAGSGQQPDHPTAISKLQALPRQKCAPKRAHTPCYDTPQRPGAARQGTPDNDIAHAQQTTSDPCHQMAPCTAYLAQSSVRPGAPNSVPYLPATLPPQALILSPAEHVQGRLCLSSQSQNIGCATDKRLSSEKPSKNKQRKTVILLCPFALAKTRMLLVTARCQQQPSRTVWGVSSSPKPRTHSGCAPPRATCKAAQPASNPSYAPAPGASGGGSGQGRTKQPDPHRLRAKTLASLRNPAHGQTPRARQQASGGWRPAAQPPWSGPDPCPAAGTGDGKAVH